jgi:hypothetical protein
MHDDTGPLRALQHAAHQAAEQLTALLAQAVAAGVHPPRLLAEAAWGCGSSLAPLPAPRPGA